MVGVGDIPLKKELPDGRKLVVAMGWESDEGLVDYVETIDGTLPESGCTSYTLGIEGDDQDYDEEPIKEFNFRGGGDLRTDEVPPIVRKAFDEWYERLMGGVAETTEITMSEPVGGNRKLVLCRKWDGKESPAGWERGPDGKLPGWGATHYTIGIREGEELDFAMVFQEYAYEGGDLSEQNVPPEVRQAFDFWYEKLVERYGPAEAQ